MPDRFPTRPTTYSTNGDPSEVDVFVSQGQAVDEICRRIGVSEQSYCRWRKEYGGLKVEQARRLKDLEQENARLKRAVADLTLDKLILKEAVEGNWYASDDATLSAESLSTTRVS